MRPSIKEKHQKQNIKNTRTQTRSGGGEILKWENLYKILQLDHVPVKPKEKDRRYASRNEARNYAIASREGLKKNDKCFREGSIFTTDKVSCTVERFFLCLDGSFQRE